MTSLSLLLMAASLAVDATVVAAARGMATDRFSARSVVAVGAVFGGFHALMPSVGWLLGDTAGTWLNGTRPWLAFAVLTALGARMAWDGLREPRRTGGGGLTVRALLPVGLTTSLDAAAAGVALPALDAPLLGSVLLIGAVTALLSGAGAVMGRRLGALMEGHAEVLGGVVLVGFGVARLAQ